MANFVTFTPDAAKKIVDFVRNGKRPSQKRQTGSFKGTGRQRGTVSGILMKVTGSTQDGDDKAWIYSLAELSGDKDPGYGGWSLKDGGITTDLGYNYMEDMNGASGLFGNGTDSDNYVGSFDIQPIPAGAIVRAFAKNVVDDDDGPLTEYWFNPGGNGVDGGCT